MHSDDWFLKRTFLILEGVLRSILNISYNNTKIWKAGLKYGLFSDDWLEMRRVLELHVLCQSVLSVHALYQI